MRMCPFRAQNCPFVLNKFSLVQTIIVTFIYLLTLFIGQNLKKSLPQIQSYDFWTQIGPFAPNQKFFGKLLIQFSSAY